MADSVDAKAGGSSPPENNVPRLNSGKAQSDLVSDRYKMDHKYRGVAVIINNENFEPSTNLKERKGTDFDAIAMNAIFQELGFKTIIEEKDVTRLDMKGHLLNASSKDYTDSDCFACVILSHGDKDYVWGTDAEVTLDELVAPFKGDKCPSLAGKPKLFFIQACRGKKTDTGVDVCDAVLEKEDMNVDEVKMPVDEVQTLHIPAEADFLMAFSTVPGFYAWRHSKKGSYFIQALVKVLKKDTDLLQMMTRVCKIVAIDFESEHPKEHMNRKKQIPCIASMLTKDVYF